MDINQIAHQLTKAGLRQRPSQLKMISEAYSALSAKKILCLEAPTGTGKTISYGIAAYLARKDKQTIVISTATTALQEQLFQKDLPLLANVLEQPIRAALAKGRRRYVCHARLYSDELSNDFFSNNDYQQTLRKNLENSLWDGDRDHLNFEISESQWQLVTTDTAGCSGKSCSFFSQCAFYRAKQKWQQSDFVITNHSLLLSDLALGSGTLLPKIEKSIYIIDECHQLPEKALDYFAKSVNLNTAKEWLNTLLQFINRAVQIDLVSETRGKKYHDISKDIHSELDLLLIFLTDNPDLFVIGYDASVSLQTWRCPEEHEFIFDWGRKLQADATILAKEIQLLLIEWEEKLKLSHDLATQQQLTKQISQLGFFKSRADSLYQTWELFCQCRAKNEAPIARWFTKSNRNQFNCHAAPINISHELKNLFWNNLQLGALLCSGTIRSMGSFTDFNRRIGLKDHIKLAEYALETYFDYSKSTLFVPTMKNAPQGQEQTLHWQEVIQLLPDLFLKKGGNLVLFSSKKAMENTFERLATDLKIDILMQQDSSKSILISRHIEKIRAGTRSILFGLASFGEGLDLPADLCQHVIIHKLPFTVPTTPVELTRNEWLRKNKQDPFALSTLPATSIRLAQYVGRLIRQETDVGIVTILDKRLYSKAYGTLLLKSLPPFHQLLNVSVEKLKENRNVQELYE